MRYVVRWFAFPIVVMFAATCAASAQTPGAIAVTVLSAPGGAPVQGGAVAAALDLGTVSGNIIPASSGVHILRRARSYVVLTRIGLRATSSSVVGSVSLQAFLDEPLPGITVSIDGTVLAAVPRVFAQRVPLGALTTHTLEIEIPNTRNPAQVPQTIPLEFGARP